MMKTVPFFLILSIFFLDSNLVFGEKIHQMNEGDTPLPLGNFSVPLVTQISPLVSFGQLLIGEKAFLSQLSGNYTQGQNSSTNTINPNVIYGIRDPIHY